MTAYMSERQGVLLTALAGQRGVPVSMGVWVSEAQRLSLSWYGRDLDTPPGRRLDLTIGSLVRRELVTETPTGYVCTRAGREAVNEIIHDRITQEARSHDHF